MTTGRLLIVDDTPANLELLVGELERRGHDVAVALDGEEAIERARYVQPDLVLLDVMMPGIDGFETCRRLKQVPATSDIPVIFMTSLADTRSKVIAFGCGGVDYVTKPFQIDEVAARVQTHLALRASLRELAAKHHALEQAHEGLLESEAALRHQALHDALTGLPNRSLLADRIGQAIALARRHRTTLRLCIVDIDHFHEINDRFGHDAGDVLLQTVGRRIAAEVSAADTVARLDSDRFVVLLHEDGADDAAAVLARIQQAIAQPIDLVAPRQTVACRVGCSRFPDDGDSADALLSAADAALRECKVRAAASGARSSA